MTRTQAKQQLIDLGISEPTEEQITKLLDSVTEETKSEKARADKYKEKADKADDLEQQLTDLQYQNLSDDEKRQKEKEQLEQKVAELTANSFKSEAKAILKGAGMDDESIKALLPGMIADTLENTQARANAYVSAMNKSIENAIKAKEKDDLDGTGTPGGEGGEDEKSNAEKIAANLFGAKKQENNILSHYIDGGN